MDSAQTATARSTPFDVIVERELLARLEKLRRVSQQNGQSVEFASFVSEVDAAWKKFQNGTYGVCEECHEAMNPEQMLADPLQRICLNELTGRQREALEDDLQLAAEIQRGLLPEKGLVHGRWYVDFEYQPLGVVSGDYCDVMVEDGDLYFILGDVSGKGMAASLLMSNLHAIFHSLVPLRLDLTELVTRANRLLLRSSLSNQFVTLVCGKASADGQVEIVNAGHFSPLVIKHGIKGEVSCGGLPLGMFSEAEYASALVKLDDGDTLLLFTDGLTETVDVDEAEFGTDGILAAIDGFSFEKPGQLIDRCIENVTLHRGEAERKDDLSILALSLI